MQVEPFKVICINDKNIPKEIPKELHIKYGETYTVDAIVHLLSSPVIGFKLQELPLGEECFPYHYWGSHRFGLLNRVEEEMLEEAIDGLFEKTPNGA